VHHDACLYFGEILPKLATFKYDDSDDDDDDDDDILVQRSLARRHQAEFRAQ